MRSLACVVFLCCCGLALLTVHSFQWKRQGGGFQEVGLGVGRTVREPGCLNPHRCQHKALNLQGEHLNLHLFPGKAAFEILLHVVFLKFFLILFLFFIFSASDTKSRVFSVLLFLLGLTTYWLLRQSIVFASGSQVLFGKLKPAVVASFGSQFVLQLLEGKHQTNTREKSSQSC